jgi:dihydrofolate reductase
MKYISMIVAVDENNGIGKNNQLPWHIQADLKRFRQITLDHTVIMGKNTFLSLPAGPLKNRRNLVMTKNPANHFKGCETVFSLKEALEKCDVGKENFIVGGASIYKLFLPVAKRLYITRVHHTFEADTFFPDIEAGEWEEISRETHDNDGKSDFGYSFIILKRKNYL